MSHIEIARWERSFRAEAKADGYAILRDHLRRLGLPDSPELLLEGTILAIRGCFRYTVMDGLDSRHFERLLEMQPYDPAESTDACYAFTFDIAGYIYARVLVEPGFKTLDLADMYGHPWDDYKVAGFSCLYVSRIDWSELASEELRQLKTDVTNDLRFDYTEEEVDFWFDDAEKTYPE